MRTRGLTRYMLATGGVLTLLLTALLAAPAVAGAAEHLYEPVWGAFDFNVSGVTLASDGCLYTVTRNVMSDSDHFSGYSPSGAIVFRIPETEPFGVRDATNVEVDDAGHVYAASSSNIKVYDTSGTYERTLPISASWMEFTPDGSLHVAGYAPGIDRYIDGVLVDRWGSDHLTRAWKVFRNPVTGEFLVDDAVDGYTHRVHRFSADYEWLGTVDWIPAPYAGYGVAGIDAAGRIVVIRSGGYYEGAVEFYDWGGNLLDRWDYRDHPDYQPALGVPSTTVPFDPRRVATNAQGALAIYFGDAGAGAGTVVFRPSNDAPVAVATADPAVCYVNQQVTFDGSGSADPDGQIVSYDWDFGDGTGGSGVTAAHAYTAPGDYTATLTVTDDHGATASASVIVTVRHPSFGLQALRDSVAAATFINPGGYVPPGYQHSLLGQIDRAIAACEAGDYAGAADIVERFFMDGKDDPIIPDGLEVLWDAMTRLIVASLRSMAI